VVEVEPFHLDRAFDYLVGDDLEHDVVVGSRVEVVFAGRRRRAIVAELTDHSDVEPSRLRPIRRTLGPHAWATPDDLEVFRWAAERWGAPVADVVRHALPGRTVAVERSAASAGWFPPPGDAPPAMNVDPPAAEGWAAYGDAGMALAERVVDGHGAHVWRPLPGEDVAARLTELVLRTVAAGRDAIVVTPDGASRIARRLVEALTDVLGADAIADVRGDHGPRPTYRAWLRSRCGRVRVLIGERGVVFWPVARLGLTVVVDEANPAHKERRSPRHHAREVALERARRSGAVALLTTTVPSAAAWALLRDRRLVPIVASRDLERRQAPRIHVDDASTGPRTRLGTRAVPALRRAVRAGRYGVVLAARAGEGTALVCAGCGHRFRCPTCGGSIADDRGDRHCRTCGWRQRPRPCPDCGSREAVPLAAGVARLGSELSRAVDGVTVMEGHDQPVPPAPAVLVMTRGSVMDAPPGPVGAIVIADLDALVRRPTADAPEDALRLAMALASWAAGDEDAEVIVRSDEPGGAVVQALVRWDPGGFWRDEAPRRAEFGFPPASHAIVVHADGDGGDLLAAVTPHAARVLGPVPSERGLQRVLCLVPDRAELLAALRPWREQASRDGRTVRVDVDPVDSW
jgi:primosomal protein N' (replication factor Y) (superfamily II helicase)